jgi:type IX secretion system PorP/SprF family membrane protein
MHKLKIKTLLIICFACMCPNLISAQQDPLLTQYMFNTLALNPAYAGTNGVLSVMLASRHQWVGFEDAPTTQTFTIHTPVAKKNFGTGLTVIHDKIGPVTNTSAWFDYSYHLRFNGKAKLALGLKGGFSYFQKDLSRYQTEVGTNDQAYAESTEPQLLPNFGFGAYFWSDRYYVGLSTPRLIENELGDSEAASAFISKENRLYLLMAGYVVRLGPDWHLKPSFIIRATESAPVSYDFNLNLLIKERLWIGGFYRPTESVGGIIQYRITNQLSAGYAYETGIKDLVSQFGDTHEVMLSFEFNFRKDKILNPRYF